MKTLKTLTLIAIAVVTLTAFSNNANAQTADDTGTVNLTAELLTSITLNLTTGSAVTFTFDSYADYDQGVGLNDDIKTLGTVAATCDWSMSCKAATNFVHDGGNGEEIPIGQVGLKIASDGTLPLNTNAMEQVYTPLNTTGIDLLEPANGVTTNAGTADNNKFTITWQMGAGADVALGSLLEENYKKGTYTAAVTLTLAEVLSHTTN